MFRAEAKGKELHFENAGVIGGNEVFRDKETGSRWQQSSLEAISGPLKGEHLELREFLLTTWEEWLRLHPNTLVLKPLPCYAERIPEKNRQIQEALLQRGNAPADALLTDKRLPPRTMILGLTARRVSKAYPLNSLREARVINEVLGGDPVVIIHQPRSDTTTAFSRRVNGKTLRFKASNSQASELTDVETGSRWDAYGHAISGKLRGTELKTLILEPEFWYAWSEFHPGTLIYGGARQHK